MALEETLQQTFIGRDGNIVEGKSNAILYYRIYGKIYLSIIPGSKMYFQIELYDGLKEVKDVISQSFDINSDVKKKILELKEYKGPFHFII